MNLGAPEIIIILVIVLLLYSGLAEQWLVARHRAKGTDVARMV